MQKIQLICVLLSFPNSHVRPCQQKFYPLIKGLNRSLIDSFEIYRATSGDIGMQRVKGETEVKSDVPNLRTDVLKR